MKLAPTDDKIIRVEKLLGIDIPSQLIASVLAKKISMGSKKILIDIPYGEGSKVKTLKKARELKRSLIDVARRFKLDVAVVFTDGRNPIGNGIGPVLEMIDIIRVLRNDPAAPMDLRKKSLALATGLLKLNGVSSPKRKARKALDDGRAYAKFKGIINAQNGSKDFEVRTSKLSAGKFERDIYWGPGGLIKGIDNRSLNALCRILGCPKDSKAGVYLYRKKGIIRK